MPVQNSVSTATDIPEIGKTVKKTTVTTVIPSDSVSQPEKLDFWDYTKGLPPEWGSPPDRHLLYVYRVTAETGPLQPLEKCTRMTLQDNTQVDVRNREEFEFGLFGKYGGGTYLLILKRGAERAAQIRVRFDGPPKNTQPGILADASAQANPSQTGDAKSDVAISAMNLVGNRDAEAVNVAISALRGASDVVQRFSKENGNGGSMNDMLMQAMIQRLLAPQPDPIEALGKVIAVFQSINGVLNPAASQNPTLAKILDTAVDRMMNPLPSGPATSTGAELVRQLPQIGGYVAEAIREWRVGTEAQLQTAHIMASQRPALPPGNGTGQPAPGQPGRSITQATQISAPAAAPSSAPAPGALPMGAPSLEFIESKIVEILQRDIPTAEAADEVLSFLDLMAPSMVEQLAQLNETQLMQVFQSRPTLRQYHDLARLQEFVRAFLKYAKPEPAPSVDTASKPN